MELSTKDKILMAALDLFSERGYDNVSVDQIAEYIGIKGPSLYKHYQGKQDIMNKLLDSIDDHYSKNVSNIRQEVKTKEEFLAFVQNYISFTLVDERVIKIRKLYTLEQFKNERMKNAATLHSILIPVRMFESLFNSLKDRLVDPNNIHMQALEFASPVSLLIQSADRGYESKEKIKKEIFDYFDYYISKYFK